MRKGDVSPNKYFLLNLVFLWLYSSKMLGIDLHYKNSFSAWHVSGIFQSASKLVSGYSV